MKTVGMRELRLGLRDVVDDVEFRREVYEVKRAGRPVARLIPIEDQEESDEQ